MLNLRNFIYLYKKKKKQKKNSKHTLTYKPVFS